ncbi:hypothetical protein HK104_006286 [Borealophlyctis nickersoniae]|nr:hypothetical protein HK104_006286 [Borealophlyctis nickersoniae]
MHVDEDGEYEGCEPSPDVVMDNDAEDSDAAEFEDEEEEEQEEDEDEEVEKEGYFDEEEDDLGGTWKPTRTTVQYVQNEDDASDYYPSDEESEIPGRTVTHSKMRRLRVTTVLRDVTYNYSRKTPPAPGPRLYWYAQMRKYKVNPKDGMSQWVNKGPVLVHVNPTNPNNIVANFVYGMRTVALNMIIPELFEHHILQITPRTVIFSTCKNNFITGADSECATVTCQEAMVVPGQATVPLPPWIATQEVNKWHHSLKLDREEEHTVIALTFKKFEPVAAVREYMVDAKAGTCEAFVAHAKAMAFSEREKQTRIRCLMYTAECPQLVHPECQERISSEYASCPNFVLQLAQSGIVFTPKTTHHGLTTCTCCGAEFTWKDPSEDVYATHRNSPTAQMRGCLFVFAPGEAQALRSNMYRAAIPQIYQHPHAAYGM